MRLRGGRLKPISAAAASAVGVAALGAVVTDLGPWYYSLRKPRWQPPDWAFGPAWTLIFALTALAGYLTWRGARSRDERLQLLAALALNAFLNTFWSLLFFRLQRPDWALYEVGFLWLSIVLLMVLMRRISSHVAWLLLPYLLWVSFASVLNWEIIHLNGPFTAHG